MKHCSDNKADRDLGAYWERQFCMLAGQFGKAFTPLQLKRQGAAEVYHWQQKGWQRYTLPDITVWSYPGEHHEIKHKAPTYNGMFGLEQYRLEALLWFAKETRQWVMYTIHNHALSGGRDATENHIEHWFTTSVNVLKEHVEYILPGTSWVNSIPQTVPICYWKESWWLPLRQWWRVTS